MSAQDQEDLAPTQDSIFSELEKEDAEEEAGEDAGEDVEEDVEDEAEEEEGGAKPPPGCWEGSSVCSAEIDWLYKSRRIPEGVTCRRPGNEVSPTPEPGGE